MVIDVTRAFQQAAVFHDSGRFADAELQYRTALKLDARHFNSLCGLGLLLLQKGDFSEAAEFWRLAVATDKKSAEARLGLAGAMTGLKLFDSAIRHYEKAIALRPNFAEAHNNLGYTFQLLGKNQAATAHFERALKIIPDYPEAHNNIGNARQAVGEFENAIKHYQHALAARPNYSQAQHNLANALSKLGRYQEALQEWQKVLALNPDFAAAHVALGDALVTLDRIEEAIAQYQKAITVKTDHVEGYVHLGDLLYDLGRIDEAVSQYERALAIDPDDAAAHNSLGTALKALGRMDDASSAFENAIALLPDRMGGYYNFVYCRRVSSNHPHILTMRKMSKRASQLSDNEQMLLQYGLAKVSADAGDHEQSFHHLLQANALARRQAHYDEAETVARLERTQATFTLELLRERIGSGYRSKLPVFIVGMPRSGTTLVEQILASHPKVFGAGELNDLNRVARNITRTNGEVYPEAIPEMTDDQLRHHGEWYVRAIRSLDSTAERITDKMPTNFGYIGLLHLILPDARIVHIRRDPIDTALSIFSLLFLQREGRLAATYSYNLAELGRFYRAYRKLMSHWRAVLPEGIMLEIDYERIVDDFDSQARRIVAHCGLEWDDACATFYKSKRPVTTPSATHVRRPIYSTSVGRWRPSNEQLKPLTDALNGE